MRKKYAAGPPWVSGEWVAFRARALDCMAKCIRRRGRKKGKLNTRCLNRCMKGDPVWESDIKKR